MKFVYMNSRTGIMTDASTLVVKYGHAPLFPRACGYLWYEWKIQRRRVEKVVRGKGVYAHAGPGDGHGDGTLLWGSAIGFAACSPLF